MKKVLKLILALAIVAALAVTAFASPITEDRTGDVADNAITYDDTNANLGAADVSYDTDYVVVVVEAPQSDDVSDVNAYIEENFDNAQMVGSVEVTATNSATGEKIEVPYTQEISGLGDYIGKTLAVGEKDADGNVSIVSSVTITGDTMSVTFMAGCTYTFFITDTPASASGVGATEGGVTGGASVSPQTSQTMLTGALVCVAAMAILGTAIAAKRKFD